MEIKRIKPTKQQNKNMLDLLSPKLKRKHEEVKADKGLFLTLMFFGLKIVMPEPYQMSFSSIDFLLHGKKLFQGDSYTNEFIGAFSRE